jgi:Flp pilus assembly protein TadG
MRLRRVVERSPRRDGIVRRLHWFLTGSRAEAGGAGVEFAVIAPMLVLAIVGTVDLGLGLYQNMQVQNAAQAGAVYATSHTFSAASISAVVSAATKSSSVTASPAPAKFCGCASNAGVAANACSASCPAGAIAGTYISVNAQASYSPLLPYPFLPGTLTLSAQSIVRVN